MTFEFGQTETENITTIAKMTCEPLKLKYKNLYVDDHGYYTPNGKLCGHIADFILHRRTLPGYDADDFPEALDEEKLIFDLMLHD